MSKKPVGYRMCIACRTSYPKDGMMRFYLAEDGTVKQGNGSGKGVYVCRSESCTECVRKKKLLNRAFRTAVSEEAYETIRL